MIYKKNAGLKEYIFAVSTMASSIPNEIMQILRDRELTPSKRLVAYAMLVPGLPGDPAHELMCQANLELGKRIKELINNGTIEITGIDRHSVLNIRVCV